MLVRTLILLLALAAGSPAAAESRAERVERLQTWRFRLESAAGLGDDPGAALSLYRSILVEAEAIGDRGLLAARAADGLADVYRRQRRFDLAAPHYERAAADWERLLGPAQPRRAVTLHNLGVCYVELGRWDEAERVLDQALAIWSAGDREERAAETRKALRAAAERRPIPWD